MVLFFCDLHLSNRPTSVHRNVAQWLAGVLREAGNGLVVFGGDLLQTNDPRAFDLLKSLLSPPTDPNRWLWLGGNRDSLLAQYVRATPSWGRGIIHPVTIDVGELTCVLLSRQKLTSEDWSCLATAATKQRQLVVFSHWSAVRFDDNDLAQLAAIANRATSHQPVWVAGHSHESNIRVVAGWQAVVCRGLDPFRAVGGRPTYLRLAMRAGRLHIDTHVIPEAMLAAPIRRQVRFGIAPQASVEQAIAAARQAQIAAVQLQSKTLECHRVGEHQRLIDVWRSSVAAPHLSLHLPQPEPDDDGARRRLDDVLAWAQALGVDDLTAHLPKRCADQFLDESTRSLNEAGLAAADYYAELAQRIESFGGRLSLENIHNSKEHRRGDLPDRLSTRPWHMRAFIEAVRRRLEQLGGDGARVGMTFDSGHARNNGLVSEQVMPADWIAELGDLIQIVHAHQVADSEKGMINHQAIRHLHERYINHEGLMLALAATDGPDCVVFAEVRDVDDAVRSYRTLDALTTRLTTSAIPARVATDE